MSNQQTQERKKIFWTLSKLTMYSKPIEGSVRKPSLKVDFYKNNPRLCARTGVENDKDYGRITASLDPILFGMTLDMLEEACKFKPTEDNKEFKVKIETKRPDFRPNAERGSKVTESEVFVGKDRNGMVWISVCAYNRPNPKFEFGTFDWCNFYHASGERFSPAELSVYHARNWIKIFRSTLGTVMQAEFIPEDFSKNRGGQQQRGGYNNGNSSRGGYNGGGNNNQRPQAPANFNDTYENDEDIPY